MSLAEERSQGGSSGVVEEEEEIELEWEEWDGKSPFLHHCIAGSVAGVAEHTLVYPVDTVKTHMQAYCPECPNNPANMNAANSASNAGSGTKPSTHSSRPSVHLSASSPSLQQKQHGMLTTMRNLVNHGHSTISAQPSTARQTASLAAQSLSEMTQSITQETSTSHTKGYSRLWRGVQTMAVGCIPAHALYFSSYEICKSLLSHTVHDPTTRTSYSHLGPMGASIAGATATLGHDVIMTPLDTIKQRMQLGHYTGMTHAIQTILKSEGWVSLYRSFGVTVATNIPYGMIMVSTNEFLRDYLKQNWQTDAQRLDLKTTMLAGCGAGAAAAAATTPLDRIKTRLQVQRLGTLPTLHSPGSNLAAGECAASVQTCPKAAAALAKVLHEAHLVQKPQYLGWNDAFGSIVREEGYAGLWRGMVPRLLTHTPAVAISWTAYEATKKWLAVGMEFDH